MRTYSSSYLMITLDKAMTTQLYRSRNPRVDPRVDLMVNPRIDPRVDLMVKLMVSIMCFSQQMKK
jgi:hypothetical protein